MGGEQNDARLPDEVTQRIAIWGAIAVVLTIIIIVYNDSPMVLGASFMAKVFAAITGSALGTIGALVGDWIRKLIGPDFVMTSSISSLVWAKIFWAVGPQLIGLIVGVALGASLVLN